MPSFRRGNMFDYPADLFVVTTNGSVNANGKLVMGKGAARDAARRWPTLSTAAGERLRDPITHEVGPTIYGFIVIGDDKASARPQVGLFQVKRIWSEKAKLSLIGYSIVLMNHYLSERNDLKIVSLNFPGIGLGGLEYRHVKPLLADLDDRVTVWSLRQ
jgi:hypothetical protein